MNSLPSIHDHSLLEYRVDLANRRITLITVPEEAGYRSNVEPLFTVFDGLEGHHFDAVSSGVIFSDIEETPLADFIRSRQIEFDATSKMVGAPVWWRGSPDEAEAYLATRHVHAFEINSSYGFSGWVLATEVRQSK
jgi:hypothetical protein